MQVNTKNGSKTIRKPNAPKDAVTPALLLMIFDIKKSLFIAIFNSKTSAAG